MDRVRGFVRLYPPQMCLAAGEIVADGAQAVVVGATGQVGGAIVVQLCKAGVPVVAVARDRDRLEQLSATDDGIIACPRGHR
jgi:NAD(P)-dependent dehydrogenase (short-subunit alcohol dehydrogenase family)